MFTKSCYTFSHALTARAYFKVMRQCTRLADSQCTIFCLFCLVYLVHLVARIAKVYKANDDNVSAQCTFITLCPFVLPTEEHVSLRVVHTMYLTYIFSPLAAADTFLFARLSVTYRLSLKFTANSRLCT